MEWSLANLHLAFSSFDKSLLRHVARLARFWMLCVRSIYMLSFLYCTFVLVISSIEPLYPHVFDMSTTDFPLSFADLGCQEYPALPSAKAAPSSQASDQLQIPHVCMFFLLWQGSNAICIHLSFWIPIRSIFRLEVVFFFVFFFSTQNLGFFKQHGSISPESNWNWSRSRPLLSAASNSKDDSFWARILLVAWYLARIFLATRVYSYGVSSFWPSKTTNLLVLLASTALPILFPLGKAKREDSWSNSEPWGKQARDSSGRSCRGQCSTTPVGLWEACTSLSNLSLSLSISIYIYKSISISMYIYK